MIKGDGVRRRNPKATSAAILTAAREAFTRDGYESVSLRQIAGEAGVDASAIIRHFGSKDGLYAEAMRTEHYLPAFQAGDYGTMAERLVRRILEIEPSSQAHQTLVAFLRSAASKTAAPHLSNLLEDGFVRVMSAEIKGEDAELRAGAVSACLLGVAISRHILAAGAFGSADPDRLVNLLAPLLQDVIDGPDKAGS